MPVSAVPAILILSGSLRSNSSTQLVIQALEKYAPAGVRIVRYEGLGRLPHFDDNDVVPEGVTEFRSLLKAADGVLICTPEYAFGVPGSLKNALDWTVSSAEFVDKPVALVTAATGGENAHASLLLTLSALSANVKTEATLLISFIRSRLDKDGNVKDAETVEGLRRVLTSLVHTISNL